jgi:VanZ family protein
LASGSSGQAQSKIFLRFWLPVLAYVSIIFALSAQQHLTPPLHFQNSDKVMHLLEYGGLGLLLSRAMRASLPGRTWLVTALLTVGVGMAVGAGDEFFQSFVPGRESSVFDWFADSTGMLFAQIGFLALAKDRETHD